MFRFLRRENLRLTRRRSASCPNLEQVSFDDEFDHRNEGQHVDRSSSSESDSDEKGASKLERLKAQRSIRRVKQKEKEKKTNAEKNHISMDDYLGKLSDLKMWLREERKKDVDAMRSPKLKTYFKTFIKLWNKRRLPVKYYKCCSVDLQEQDKPSSPVYPDIIETPLVPRYSLGEDPETPLTPMFPHPIDLSADNILEGNSTSFSTFGKSGSDPLSSPTILTEEVTQTERLVQAAISHSSGEPHSAQSSNSCISPQKFATISRSTPASSLYKFSAQPWSLKGEATIHPVASPKCPDLTQSQLALPSTPVTARTLPHNFTPGGRMNGSNLEKWVAGWNKSTEQSPIYASVIDAIPYSTGSPKYAEIDPAADAVKPLPPPNNPPPLPPPNGNLPPLLPPPNDYGPPPLSQENKQPSSDYCSISPLQEWKPKYDIHESGLLPKKPFLNRRRSKSMEDIYSVPVKVNTYRERKQESMDDDMDMSMAPPVPDKKFSPHLWFSTFSGFRDKKPQNLKEFQVCNKVKTSSSSSTAHSLKCPPQKSTQKRCSQENEETIQQNTSPLKKTKSVVSKSDQDSLLTHTPERITDTPTPMKLSNLTGSLKPTTRSRHGLIEDHETSKSTTNTDESNDHNLSILEVQQLDESPKFPRRRLKRRSSSFSTTPGKGLMFGKTSKMSSASPRRVSFAKDVIDTEPKSTPRRRSSRHGMTSNTFTRQTQERKEFETFLSSHVSTPKKSNMPSKVASPPRQGSVRNVASPLRQGSLRVVASPPKQGSLKEKLTNPFTSLLDAKKSQIKTLQEYSPHTLEDTGNGSPFNNALGQNIGEDRLFPPSPVKQLGHRMLGTPIQKIPQKTVGIASRESSFLKHSKSPEKLSSPHKKSVISPPKQLSPPKKFFDSTLPLSLPKIPIHSLVSKLTDKTATICANEVCESECYSSSDELLQPAASKVSSMSMKDQPNTQTNSKTLILPTTSVKGRDGKPETKNFEVIELDGSPGSRTKKISNSDHSFSDTSNNFNSETKASDSGIHDANQLSSKSSEDVVVCSNSLEANHAETHPNIKYPNSQMKESNSINFLEVTHSKILFTKSDKLTSDSASRVLDKDFSLTSSAQVSQVATQEQIDASMGMSTSTLTDTGLNGQPATSNIIVFGDANSGDFFTSASLEAFEKKAKICKKQIEITAARLTKQSSMTAIINEDSGDFEKRQENSDQCRARIYAKINKVFVKSNTDTACNPMVSQYVANSCQRSAYKENENAKGAKSYDLCFEDGDETNQHANCAPDKETKYLNITASLHVKEQGYEYTSCTQPTKETEILGDGPAALTIPTNQKKKDWKCDLKRPESLKASPKIVENDGWITERRRSSRGKSRSFRSAYNRYLLRTSSKEDSEGTEDDSGSGADKCSVDENRTPRKEVDKLVENDVETTYTSEQKNPVNSGKNDKMLTGKLKTNQSAEITANTNYTDKNVETDVLDNAVAKKSGNTSENKKALAEKLVKYSDPDDTPAANANIPHESNTSSSTATDQTHDTALPRKPVVSSTLQKKQPPSVMPKPSSGTILAQKHLKVGNSVNAKSNTVPKRRSSMMKKDLPDSKSQKEANKREANGSKENYIKKNIHALRRDSSLSSGALIWSKLQNAGQRGRKQSSIGSGGNSADRRRSKGKTATDENEMSSFSDKRKFFQQFQAKGDSKEITTKAKESALQSKNNHGACKHMQATRTEIEEQKVTSPNVKSPGRTRPSVSPKIGLLKNQRQLALSPNSDLKF